jgi:iron complex outermembrane receptor protein
VSLVLGSTVTGSVFNAASAEINGVELQTIVRPTSDLTLSATYAYTKPKYKKFDAVVLGALRDFSDRDLTGVPRHAATATVEYRLPVDPSHGEVNLLVNYTFQSGGYLSDLYQSKQQLSFQYTPAQLGLIADNTIFKTKSSSLFDASVSWKGVEGRPVDLTFYMRNVFDRRYTVGGISLYESLGVTQVQYGPPRTFGVELTYRFK